MVVAAAPKSSVLSYSEQFSMNAPIIKELSEYFARFCPKVKHAP